MKWNETLCLCIGWAALSAISIEPADLHAEDILIVVPNELANVEGTLATSGGPWPDGFRVQEWYPAEQFDSLPEPHRLITGYRLRPDASVTEPGTFTVGWTIKVSTVSLDLLELGTDFDENHGPDAKVVFDGDWTFTTEASGPKEGPREFDIALDYDEPFFYDPNQGNLLVEVTRASSNQRTPALDRHNLFGNSLIGTTDANATEIEGWFPGTVTQFVFSPTGAVKAGDANLDLSFDQLDLVQVLIAAKYLTGMPATWGEGDWDAAPGGTKDDPPVGNGRFDQRDIITALASGAYLTGPYAASIAYFSAPQAHDRKSGSDIQLRSVSFHAIDNRDTLTDAAVDDILARKRVASERSTQDVPVLEKFKPARSVDPDPSPNDQGHPYIPVPEPATAAILATLTIGLLIRRTRSEQE